MKRKTATVELFTLRDMGGELILAMRIAAARQSLSMNEWLLQVVRDATRMVQRQMEKQDVIDAVVDGQPKPKGEQ